jgi:hypothetical protein
MNKAILNITSGQTEILFPSKRLMRPGLLVHYSNMRYQLCPDNLKEIE